MKAAAAALSLVIALAGCGARTGPRRPDVFDSDVGSDARDATPDVPPVQMDTGDVVAEAPPPFCVAGGVPLVYLVSQDSGLYSYYPPTGAFVRIGTIVCPVDTTVTPLPTPFSMGVDRRGTAYVLYTDGHLFRVSTASARCEATPFRPNQRGFLNFGMGFTSNTRDPGETLYVAEADFEGDSQGLAAIDTVTFELRFIGRFSQRIGRSELTGSGDGRLFAFGLEPTTGSIVAQLDPETARVVSATPLPIGDPSNAFAVAFWDNDFYVFTALTGTATTVTRYSPRAGTLSVVGSLGAIIVGAGVSTCAPH